MYIYIYIYIYTHMILTANNTFTVFILLRRGLKWLLKFLEDLILNMS